MSESASGPSAAAAAAATAPKKGKQSNRPSPEEIEAKRRERAAKKEKEAAEKAAKEAELAAAVAANGKIPNGHLDEHGNVLFVPRDWATVTDNEASKCLERQRVRIVSWNILAQGLVRRTLFPGSDCLKFKDRCVGLTAELSSRTGHGWDVGCFQEVDRMDVHGETLAKDGFSYVYEKGYRQKQHGLLVAWRTNIFGERAHSRLTMDLDAESVARASEPVRTACSRVTRNVGLLVALTMGKAGSGTDTTLRPGVIVATTHLFWHPMHAYERARQSGIVVRRLQEFREQLGEAWQNVPCILAGDFNDQPHSATYHLLTGSKLTQHCFDEVWSSRVVHKSMDERRERGGASNGFAAGTTEPARDAAAKTDTAWAKTCEADKQGGEGTQQEDDEDDEGRDGEEAEEEEGEEEEGEQADDRMLKNCRAARCEDGLLTMDELIQLHDVSRARPGWMAAQHDSQRSARDSDSHGWASSPHLGSAYGLHYGGVREPCEDTNYFGSPTRGRERWDDAHWTPHTRNCHTGDSTEPMWTIFSSLFSLTLDYIFMLPLRLPLLLPQQTHPPAQAATPTPYAAAYPAAYPAVYPTVTRLLRTHRTETLQPGVPRKGVCASDHIAIGAEIELPQ